MTSAPTDKPRLTGYELIEHLGSGGYGEVWSARVPGGIVKAVKLIHGRHDESRAANELKSLERIREVRHPFVVSLERIEFVDNRLVVVSELAEGSLRDRFRQCVQDGLGGIPRDELLGYLRDAADALDYLASHHGLQHLDIKPENILLLAGHAKVADFGLVKAIDDRTQSIVGGMTPAYAPPEVFKGAPCRASDQYSLAVLYQQLLTGVLPFEGENAAELTLQHLHDEPNLTPLPDDDRFVVSRALSKTPNHRYASCTEFVQTLASGQAFGSAQRGGSRASAASAGGYESAAAAGGAPRAGEAIATQVVEDEPAASTDLRLSIPDLQQSGPQRLPPPEFDASRFTAAPTLFLGIGGAAAAVLRELRQQHSERFNLGGPIPAMPMLLLDTDARTLAAASRNADNGAGLKREETLCLALRRPQEYREKADKILGWLGRRWLYNIPKSLQTEGIRPLGRLALIDHARRTVQRIRGALAECVSLENIEATEQQTGLTFRRDAVRVYVVSSAAGGAGGGMSIDVAYAVRSVLERMGLRETQLIGVTTMSTGRDPERAGLARVNAFSWITEHEHFASPANAYPGDEGVGFAPHAHATAPFDESYLVHLGERLDENAFARGCKSVADYLFVDACTPASACLDAARRAVRNAGPGRTLRTFAARRHEAAPAATRREAEQLLVNLLFSNWMGENSPAAPPTDATSTNRVVMGAGELVGRLKLDAAQLATNCRAMVEQQVRSQGAVEPRSASLADRLEEINQPFAPSPDYNNPLLGEGAPNRIGPTPLFDLVRPLTEQLQSEIKAWVIGQLNTPGDRLSGGRQAADWLHSHCESLTANFRRYAAVTQKKLCEVAQQAVDQERDGAAIETRYAHLKADYAALEAAALVVAGIKTELRETLQQLNELRASIGGLAKALARDSGPPSADAYTTLADAGANPAKLTAELDLRLQEEWNAAGVRFDQLVAADEGRRQASAAICRQAHQCVREALLAQAEGAPIELPAADELPTLGPLAAGCWRLLLAPATATTETGLEGLIRILHDSNDAYLLTECQGLSAPHAAVSLVAGRRDYAEFAARVHTRRDISWSDVLNPAPQPPAREPTAILPAHTLQVEIPTAAAPAAASDPTT